MLMGKHPIHVFFPFQWCFYVQIALFFFLLFYAKNGPVEPPKNIVLCDCGREFRTVGHKESRRISCATCDGEERKIRACENRTVASKRAPKIYTRQNMNKTVLAFNIQYLPSHQVLSIQFSSREVNDYVMCQYMNNICVSTMTILG